MGNDIRVNAGQYSFIACLLLKNSNIFHKNKLNFFSV